MTQPIGHGNRAVVEGRTVRFADEGKRTTGGGNGSGGGGGVYSGPGRSGPSLGTLEVPSRITYTNKLVLQPIGPADSTPVMGVPIPKDRLAARSVVLLSMWLSNHAASSE